MDQLCKKISFRIGILKQVRLFLDNVSSNLIYSSTILPLFDYCTVVWDTCTINSKNKLQRLQNRAAIIIQKSSILMLSDTLLAQLNLWKLETRWLFHKAILMYKCQNNEVEGVNTNLTRHLQIHNYNTRRKSNFRLPKPKTEQLKRTFRYSATQIWNSLPTDVRQCKSLSSFKLSVKHFLNC